MNVKREIEKMLSGYIGDGVFKPGATLMPMVNCYELRDKIEKLVNRIDGEKTAEISEQFSNCKDKLDSVQSQLEDVERSLDNINAGINALMPEGGC